MLEEQVAELFDVELVRCWQLDEEGNAEEPEVEIVLPEIEVDYGDCYGMSCGWLSGLWVG
jgi:hypothetical protein